MRVEVPLTFVLKEFMEQCGLIEDKPKPEFGNINDRNTAKCLFKNAELSAEITGGDLQLIKNSYHYDSGF